MTASWCSIVCVCDLTSGRRNATGTNLTAETTNRVPLETRRRACHWQHRDEVARRENAARYALGCAVGVGKVTWPLCWILQTVLINDVCTSGSRDS